MTLLIAARPPFQKVKNRILEIGTTAPMRIVVSQKSDVTLSAHILN